jgi:hypothetical protein
LTEEEQHRAAKWETIGQKKRERSKIMQAILGDLTLSTTSSRRSGKLKALSSPL